MALMALFTSSLFFGIDSLLFRYSNKSITKEISFIGFVVSVVILVFGLISYCINFPRKKIYTITELAPQKGHC